MKELQGTVNEMLKIIEALQVQVATLASKREEFFRPSSMKVEEPDRQDNNKLESHDLQVVHMSRKQ